MVKGKDVSLLPPQMPEGESSNDQTQEQLEFLFEEELNERIQNRKRRNALTSSMVQDIKDMIKNGDFDFEG